jgi:hypothetical protein
MKEQCFDILPALKGKDSLSRRSMSRTEEDVLSRVDITIMRHATLRTDPASYSEVCDTFRSRLACTRRTDSGRERFIDFLVPSPVRGRFVAEPRLGRKTSLLREAQGVRLRTLLIALCVITASALRPPSR